jgi:hypothetical protein
VLVVFTNLCSREWELERRTQHGDQQTRSHFVSVFAKGAEFLFPNEWQQCWFLKKISVLENGSWNTGPSMVTNRREFTLNAVGDMLGKGTHRITTEIERYSKVVFIRIPLELRILSGIIFRLCVLNSNWTTKILMLRA